MSPESDARQLDFRLERPSAPHWRSLYDLSGVLITGTLISVLHITIVLITVNTHCYLTENCYTDSYCIGQYCTDLCVPRLQPLVCPALF